MILILSGEPGTGKTYESQKFPEPIGIIDGEFPRAKEYWEKKNPKTAIEIFPGRVIYKESKDGHKRGQLNVVETSKVLEQSVDIVLNRLENFETIILDGASDIRSWIAQKWLYDFNTEAKDLAKKLNKLFRERKSIGRDEHAWAEINDKVGENIIFPLINACRDVGINCVLTATMKDQYKTITGENGREKNVVTGIRLTDLKNWMFHEVDTLITLEYRKPKYWAVCTKSIIGCWEMDITNKDLYEELIEKGV